jgi:uncharacterized membrane protein (UPF0127 family)
MRFLVIAVLIITGASSCSSDSSTKQPSERKTPRGRVLDYSKEIRFLDDNGAIISSIMAAVVDTDEERNQGLMDVWDMPENNGMLFVFDYEAPLSFWMANTPLSLDIIFLNKDKEIVNIHTNTPPLSERQFESKGNAMYVIEVNAGYSLKYDIREGLRVDF